VGLTGVIYGADVRVCSIDPGVGPRDLNLVYPNGVPLSHLLPFKTSGHTVRSSLFFPSLHTPIPPRPIAERPQIPATSGLVLLALVVRARDILPLGRLPRDLLRQSGAVLVKARKYSSKRGRAAAPVATLLGGDQLDFTARSSVSSGSGPGTLRPGRASPGLQAACYQIDVHKLDQHRSVSEAPIADSRGNPGL